MVYLNCGTPPGVTEFNAREVEWEVVTVDSKPLFSLTTQQYENLGNNMSEVILAARQLRATVKFYQDCLNAQEAAVP